MCIRPTRQTFLKGTVVVYLLYVYVCMCDGMNIHHTHRIQILKILKMQKILKIQRNCVFTITSHYVDELFKVAVCMWKQETKTNYIGKLFKVCVCVCGSNACQR